jgi:hypothetical protein
MFLSFYPIFSFTLLSSLFYFTTKIGILKTKADTPSHQNRKKFECVATSWFLLPLLGQWTMHTVFLKKSGNLRFF